jgi:hypothetical protein
VTASAPPVPAAEPRPHATARGRPAAAVPPCRSSTSLTIHHHDQDFELIAAITGQPVERLRLG